VNFSLAPELVDLRDMVRRFVETELMPWEDHVEVHDGLPADVEKRLRLKAVELGLSGIGMPEEIGGGGISTLGLVIVEEELSRAGSGLASVVPHPSNILLACDREQRQRFLLPCIRGERQDCFALTEPEAGSDAQSMRSRAVRSDDGWLINGVKRFISHADTADFAIFFAVTDPDAQRDRVTAFLIERGAPGFTVGQVHETMGLRGYRQAELVCNDCLVPDENVLGQVGKGFDLARDWLRNGRILTAARCLGPAERVLEIARAYALDRRQFGRAIADFQAIQFMLADSATDLFAARVMTYNAACEEDHGSDIRVLNAKAAMVKLFASEALGRIADRAVQVLGGMGYMRETFAERTYRNARIERIWEGTSEIQRSIIARALLKHRIGLGMR
jgi:acyl-CoA dehydrogenase